mgnify:CR=1 FL=1
MESRFTLMRIAEPPSRRAPNRRGQSSSPSPSSLATGWFSGDSSPEKASPCRGAVLLQVYRRLEARGEIRGGRFVAGMQGEQFARGRRR